MKTRFIALLLALSTASHAADHGHHVKHNMILLGEREVFASHIVYKVPHNYQVILKINLDAQTLPLYQGQKETHPRAQFIYLLDHMDISEIAIAESISGTILREDEQGNRVQLASGVKLAREDFEIVFFDEVPLSLE